MKIPIRMAVAVAAMFLAVPAQAQELKKTLVRSFNDCWPRQPFVSGFASFTATGPETLLTFSRTHTTCSAPCPLAPSPPYPPGMTVCDIFCEASSPCPSPWKCDCVTQQCSSGRCVAGVNAFIGYAVVLKASRFESIAACSPEYQDDYPDATCDGSGSCADPMSNVKSLCLCSDPGCPPTGHICDTALPSLPASDVVLETTATQAADWFPDFSLNGTTPVVSMARIRFATTPGEEYVVVVKYTISPIVNGFQSCPDATILMSVESRPDSCGP